MNTSINSPRNNCFSNFQSTTHESYDELSDFDDSRSSAAPQIKIVSDVPNNGKLNLEVFNNGKLNLKVAAASTQDDFLQMPRSEGRKNRVVLKPINLGYTKYDSTIPHRKSSKRSIVLKPDQIIRAHEHTNTNPFNFSSEARCDDKKAGSVYKKNEDDY